MNTESSLDVYKELATPVTSSDLSPPSFRFTKQQRLLDKASYTQVFDDAPLRASHPCFLFLCRTNILDKSRLGLVIAKKHVKQANERNRIKRLIRESFRLQQHKLPAIDAIVLARKGADTLTNAEVLVILNGLWKRITKRALTQDQDSNQ